MTPGVSAWLDRAARRLAGERDQGGRFQPRSAEVTLSDAVGDSEELISRETAVKLGLATGASLMLGLWGASEAKALDRDECIGACYDRVLERSLKDTGFCRRLYNDAVWKTDGSSWARIHEILNEGGWGTLRKITQQSLAEACESVVAKRAVNGLEKCDDACRVVCGRALAGRSSRRQVCKPPPPPKSYTPAPPDPPNMTDDPCSACTQVGGLCCGPFKLDPVTGKFQICACANPALGCERYGCG